MIISASRRTDVPALFSDWFFNRVKQGYVLSRNPYNYNQVGRITITSDNITGFVFWTKNASPMLSRIHEIERYPYYFQYTITPYGKDIEKNLPDKYAVIIPAFRKIGKEKTVWRYDPIFINETYTIDYHIKSFRKMAEQLEGYTDKAVISFIDYYKSVDLRSLRIIDLSIDQKYELASKLLEIAKAHGIELTSCAENIGLNPSCCIDGTMLGFKTSKDKNQRELCTCEKSIDIGCYNTCSNGCKYCYANRRGYINSKINVRSPILGAPLIGTETIHQRN